MKLIDIFVYSAASIAAQAPALEEEVAADLPADEPSPEQVLIPFLASNLCFNSVFYKLTHRIHAD